LIEPPEVGGGRHGYGQSGVSADVVVERTVIRLRSMVAKKDLDMAVRLREKEMNSATLVGVRPVVIPVASTYWNIWCNTNGCRSGNHIIHHSQSEENDTHWNNS
jgi:hypothetical protein